MSDMQARFNVKLFAAEPVRIAAKEFIPIFHRFIQERVLDELMVDVTDYTHVHHGPGILLVCHEAHYAADQESGRLGLYYERKRNEPADVSVSLRDALGRAAFAARALEREPAFGDTLRFATDEIAVGIRDRLNAPNTPGTFRALEGVLVEQLGRAFGVKPDLEHADDPRECFRVRARMPGAPPLEAVVARLHSV